MLTIITSLYGDKDGFGQGLPIADGLDYSDNGGSFSATGGVGDPANTDTWQFGYPESIMFNYGLDGAVLSASLEIYIAGVADSVVVDFLTGR